MYRQPPGSPIELPDDFPWDKTIGLLLDALQIKNIRQRLYEWCAAPEVDLLYGGTCWAEFSHISPCLIRIRDAYNPILQQFLANTGDDWGYLLVSDGSWKELLAHMRWLTSFCPVPDDEMYLRISYPDIAHALFAPECFPRAEVFGPCQQVVVANDRFEGWRQYHRPGDRLLQVPNAPYITNEAQWVALKAVNFRLSVKNLYRHMSDLFPGYRADLTPRQRLERVHQLVDSAIERGFRTRHEIWLYANVFGFLGDEGVQSHPDIVNLLTIESDLTSFERVDRAATLAQQRSIQ
ncbi:Uncharacterised protein [Paucimonas lemoignei]|nr:Uncharacterised protein [Paucimonas lemoignei]